MRLALAAVGVAVLRKTRKTAEKLSYFIIL
jgi:hypothetical protein